jgi:hypothetical protein
MRGGSAILGRRLTHIGKDTGRGKACIKHIGVLRKLYLGHS